MVESVVPECWCNAATNTPAFGKERIDLECLVGDRFRRDAGVLFIAASPCRRGSLPDFLRMVPLPSPVPQPRAHAPPHKGSGHGACGSVAWFFFPFSHVLYWILQLLRLKYSERGRLCGVGRGSLWCGALPDFILELGQSCGHRLIAVEISTLEEKFQYLYSRLNVYVLNVCVQTLIPEGIAAQPRLDNQTIKNVRCCTTVVHPYSFGRKLGGVVRRMGGGGDVHFFV